VTTQLQLINISKLRIYLSEYYSDRCIINWKLCERKLGYYNSSYDPKIFIEALMGSAEYENEIAHSKNRDFNPVLLKYKA